MKDLKKENLTKKGFVFINGNEVYWYRRMHNKNLNLKWSKPLDKWIHYGEANMSQAFIWEQLAMSDADAMAYHRMHERTTGDNPLNF
jgi:hypothetical protein